MENDKKKYKLSLLMIFFIVGAFLIYNIVMDKPACALISQKFTIPANNRVIKPIEVIKPIDKSKIIIIDYPPTTTSPNSPLKNIPPIMIPKVPFTLVTSVPLKTILWGAYAGNNMGDLEKFESLVGKKVGIQSFFVGWNDNFPTSIANNLKGSNKVLLIFWEQYGVKLGDINAGKSDAYIKKFAADAQAYGGPIILAPLHEMNSNWEPWSAYDINNKQLNTPTQIINAWRTMHKPFEGISNVKFAWGVNNVSVPNIPANDISVYYPGNDYVDYVGVDGFNFGNPWQTPAQIFDNAMNKLSIYKKPIYIFSTASIADSRKAAWIKDFGSQIKKYNLAGWVWFNQNGADGNWIVNSDTASLQAFKLILP